MDLTIEWLLGGVPLSDERDTISAESRLHGRDAAQIVADRGRVLLHAHASGSTWRVERGLVALFRPEEEGVSDAERFVMLAYGSDLIGVEAQLLGAYAFDAVALTPVLLVRWDLPPSDASLYWRQVERTQEVALLRSGPAEKRLERFLAVLAQAAPRAPWPRLRDIAAVVGVQVETVSRLLSRRRGTITDDSP